MAADQTVVPPSLSAKVVGSFAYLTIRDRMPTILTKVIDTIHRNKNTFFEEYGEEGIEAEKNAIGLLSKLRNELQTDKPVVELKDDLKDSEAWNQYLQRQQKLQGDQECVSWFSSPWLYVECYMYRRIHEALLLNPPISEYDVFNEGKTQSFFDSQQAVMDLCTYLEGIRKNAKELFQNQLFEHFSTLLQVSLWGNKCDLSISAGEDNSQKSSPIESLSSLHPFILVDDTNAVWATLTSARRQEKLGKTKVDRVDIVLDNAGFELVTDLVFADFLVSSGLVRQIHFHGKSLPWFVSDVTANDLQWIVRQAMAANHRWLSKCGVQWQTYLKQGVWRYHDHPFWTQPHEFCDMASDAPDLYASLQEADLVLFKGDLNYRKLTGDRDWEHVVDFNTALRGFGPAPLCSLRTLKANVQVGLQPGQAEKLTSRDPSWMTNGKYAVIQFHNPTPED
ncbi:damage-control phosphatase ARMT1 [Gouania willdenowi]|uniref:protein-glutamate O-methyltransferase-like n=1 Tax=Gouania willdenowi TaxID=441366 RepID=UPI00105589E2|nr:protein-glutamate O-methyltransferase-like [Gouania willdenowi]XP_028295318.1 protein-glutamate O-methyltransferase-like [Gouania willdenowi]